MAQEKKADKASAPMDRLKQEAGGLLGALGDRAMASVRDKVEGATGRLTGYVEDGAGPGLMAAVKGTKSLAEGKSPGRSFLGAGLAAAKEKVRGLFGKGGGKGKSKIKLTNIVESIDVGAPITLVYNQWTQFGDFPSFMKKVESVDQAEDEKLNWKAQVFWSHRTWESTIQEQAPDDRIIWRSKGDKGYVNGSVTFHELAPNLTRVLVSLEYHPQGLFERTGNMWRAQGRRVRLELKHFRRHVMSEALLHPDEIEGWRGVIEDGEVVQDHEPLSDDEKDRIARRGQAQAPDDEENGHGRPGDDADDQYAEDEEAAAETEQLEEDSAAEDIDDEEDEEEDVEPEEDARPARARRPQAARQPARRRQPAASSRRSARSGSRPQRTASRPGRQGGNA